MLFFLKAKKKKMQTCYLQERISSLSTDTQLPFSHWQRESLLLILQKSWVQKDAEVSVRACSTYAEGINFGLDFFPNYAKKWLGIKRYPRTPWTSRLQKSMVWPSVGIHPWCCDSVCLMFRWVPLFSLPKLSQVTKWVPLNFRKQWNVW